MTARKPTKIVCLKGGLGNQIFEYCRYMTLRESGYKTLLYYDRARLKQHGGVQIAECFELRLPGQSPWVAAAVCALKALRAAGVAPWLCDDCDERALLIDDYSQDIRHTTGARRWLKFRTEAKECVAGMEREIAACPHPVAVHYRRGDYLHPKNIGNFGICPPEYYAAARQTVLSRHPDARFFIFSDDTEWAETGAPNEASTVVRLPQVAPDHAAMYLMSLCHSHIIANSTFSYWGAMLADGNGMKIRPRQWFAAKDWTTPNIFDSSWIEM